MSVTSGVRGFLGRFVHPRVAAAALFGTLLIALAAVVAVVAVGLGNVGYYDIEYRYVPLASLVSLIGILIWVACGLYIGALKVLRDTVGVLG